MNRTRRAFDYKPPTFQEAERLSQRRGGMFDAIVKRDGPKFFKPKNGDNFIRILPNTWEGSKHYALEVKIHRNVGVDNGSYLCLRENEYSPEKDCPICDERDDLARRLMKKDSKVTQKDVDDCRANTNLLIYLIDRNNEAQGPQLWGMSHRSDAEILSQSLEKRQQVYLPVAHPIDGYDIEFTREGEGINTRYRGFKVARASSPVTDDADKLDEWLNYIEDNPIPDILQFFTSERIKQVFYGKIDKPEEEERTTRIRDEEPPPRQSREERASPQREEPRTEPNGQDENAPPFDVDPPARRASLDNERPSPRETATEPPAERRRVTLDEPSSDNRKSLEELRAKLRGRSA